LDRAEAVTNGNKALQARNGMPLDAGAVGTGSKEFESPHLHVTSTA
jgi:hypothetical protein